MLEYLSTQRRVGYSLMKLVRRPISWKPRTNRVSSAASRKSSLQHDAISLGGPDNGTSPLAPNASPWLPERFHIGFPLLLIPTRFSASANNVFLTSQSSGDSARILGLRLTSN